MKPRPSSSPYLAAAASVVAAIVISGCASPGTEGGSTSATASPAPSVIRGSVVYRDKVVLPADAQLVMRLVDISNPAKPVVVAETTTPTAGRQIPLSFALPFDPAKVTGKVNVLRATIRYGDQTRFVTAARVTLQPNDLPQAMTIAVIQGENEPMVGDASSATGPPPGPVRDPNIPQRSRKPK